jgi:hypothetical protein
MTTRIITIAAAAFMLAAGAQAGDGPDFTNWTTESLHEIFIPTAHITYAHGKIKTVTFPFRPKDEDGYPTKIYALDCFNLLFMFLFGPKEESNPHTHNLENGVIPGVISTKDPETGYLVIRDDKGMNYADPAWREKYADVTWQYHFTVTKDDAIILTAEMIPSEKIGPRFIVHLEPLQR